MGFADLALFEWAEHVYGYEGRWVHICLPFIQSQKKIYPDWHATISSILSGTKCMDTIPSLFLSRATCFMNF